MVVVVVAVFVVLFVVVVVGVSAFSLIRKDRGVGPLDLRPISVMPLHYRIWAALRLANFMAWQETWAKETQHGYRPGHAEEDVWWMLALRIENALLRGKQLAGLSMD